MGTLTEVSKYKEGVKIDKVYGVIDMGSVVNPGGVEVHIIADGGEVIKGAGEPGLPPLPLAPAVANAIFAAAGKMIRRMPFSLATLS